MPVDGSEDNRLHWIQSLLELEKKILSSNFVLSQLIFNFINVMVLRKVSVNVYVWNVNAVIIMLVSLIIAHIVPL